MTGINCCVWRFILYLFYFQYNKCIVCVIKKTTNTNLLAYPWFSKWCGIDQNVHQIPKSSIFTWCQRNSSFFLRLFRQRRWFIWYKFDGLVWFFYWTSLTSCYVMKPIFWKVDLLKCICYMNSLCRVRKQLKMHINT